MQKKRSISSIIRSAYNFLLSLVGEFSFDQEAHAHTAGRYSLIKAETRSKG